MSNTKKADPYRRLLKWTIILLVLLALVATAYVLMDKYQQGERDRAALRIEEENQVLIEDYNQRLARFRESQQTTGEVRSWPAPKESGWDVLDVSDFPVAAAEEAAVTREELLLGGLLLVNRWHAMPPDFTLAEPQLKSIGTETSFRVGVTNREVRVLAPVITALDAMIGAAREAGLESYIVRQGYRTAQEQTVLWDAEVALYTDRFSGDALTERARQRVAFPGTSDYHTGMSVFMDVYNRNDSALNAMAFQTTEQAKWLNEHAPEYGFIFRFPTQGYPAKDTVDKSHKTGINLSAMDVYRYVSVPHALTMKVLGFCLEEYIDYLIAHPHIAVYQDGELKYEIYRVTGGNEDTEIALTAGTREYVASTDNMNGLVVALVY
ncbi:MAG: M15 family metallopeptidase [Eubacteriales bacterium]|nr:M15 family metallopeptidase [Eubacteriales bacterium]